MLVAAARALGFGDNAKGPKYAVPRDASPAGSWMMQGLIVVGAATAGYLLGARSPESADSPPETSVLPRHSQSGGCPAQDYGSGSTSRRPSQAQAIAAQAQARIGEHHVASLEWKVDHLSALLRRAETDATRLRAKARADDALISSLRSQLSVSQTQTRDQQRKAWDLEVRVDTLSAALNRAEAGTTELIADLESCDYQLEDLREEVQNREEIISELEQETASLTLALERAELAANEVPLSHDPVSVTTGCERCTPPAHISKAKAKGMWLRDQAKALNDEAGKLLFEAQNPDLVGARARLRNDMRIELHHQFQKPAAQYVKNYATSARDQGLDTIIFIVGKGLHSEYNVPVLKPLVMQVLKGMGIEARTPERNSGEIVAKLQRRSG